VPIYEYVCRKCEKKFETLVLDPDDKITCSECGDNKIERLFSTFGFKSKNSTPLSSPSINTVGSACGCTPASCGCGVKH
jgi:putative FmdB family regulatory protein